MPSVLKLFNSMLKECMFLSTVLDNLETLVFQIWDFLFIVLVIFSFWKIIIQILFFQTANFLILLLYYFPIKNLFLLSFWKFFFKFVFLIIHLYFSFWFLNLTVKITFYSPNIHFFLLYSALVLGVEYHPTYVSVNWCWC